MWGEARESRNCDAMTAHSINYWRHSGRTRHSHTSSALVLSMRHLSLSARQLCSFSLPWMNISSADFHSMLHSRLSLPHGRWRLFFDLSCIYHDRLDATPASPCLSSLRVSGNDSEHRKHSMWRHNGTREDARASGRKQVFRPEFQKQRGILYLLQDFFVKPQVVLLM